MRNQSGASAILMLLLLMVAGAVISVGVKVIPLYVDNMQIDQAIESAAVGDFHQMSRSEIVERLSKTFSVNSIRGVNPRDFQIERDEKATTISYIHEERVNIFANLDVIVTFENFYSTAEPEE